MSYKKLSFLDVPVAQRDYDNVEPVPFTALLPVFVMLDEIAEAAYADQMRDSQKHEPRPTDYDQSDGAIARPAGWVYDPMRDPIADPENGGYSDDEEF
jgi:hypothetical protein